MKPPARAIVGNLVWSADGGVWAVWRVGSLPGAHVPGVRRLATQARLRALIDDLAAEAMLLSVCARVDPWDVAGDMAAGVDLAGHDAWAAACEATVRWMDEVALYRRRDYLAVLLPPARAPWRDVVRSAVDDVAATFGVSPRPVPPGDVAVMVEQADALRSALAVHVPLQAVDAGEVCWLHARALRRGADEPGYDRAWDPTGQVRARPIDGVVVEGGYDDDQATGNLRRYLRVDSPGGTSYQTVLALSDLPRAVLSSAVPPALGEPWLFDVDAVGFPVDWCVRWHLDRATVLLAVAAPTVDELEERAAALGGRYVPDEYGLARPVRGQLALWRSMLPGTTAATACERYAQHLTADELAAAGPFGSAAVGTGQGSLLGLSLDGGTGTPVLLDPGSLAVVGAPASGVSYLLKRLLWDTVARGAQVAVVDRSADGEYAGFAQAVPGTVSVVPVHDGDRAVGGLALPVDDDLVVVWAPMADTDTTVELAAQAVQAMAADPTRPGTVLVEDAGPLLTHPRGRALVAGSLSDVGWWLAGDTAEPLLGDDLAGLTTRVVLDQVDEELPAALALLGLDIDDAAVEATVTVFEEGLATGQCLLRDPRGRVGLVQVLPPLLTPLQDAFEADDLPPVELPLGEEAPA